MGHLYSPKVEYPSVGDNSNSKYPIFNAIFVEERNFALLDFSISPIPWITFGYLFSNLKIENHAMKIDRKGDAMLFFQILLSPFPNAETTKRILQHEQSAVFTTFQSPFAYSPWHEAKTCTTKKHTSSIQTIFEKRFVNREVS